MFCEIFGGFLVSFVEKWRRTATVFITMFASSRRTSGKYLKYSSVSPFCFRLENLPNDEIGVPAEIQPAELTELVNSSAKSVDGNVFGYFENVYNLEILDLWKDVSLNFLLNGQLIRTPLSEFVQENNLNTESVLEIECILQEPAPIPEQNIVDDDWVAAVLVTKKL